MDTVAYGTHPRQVVGIFQYDVEFTSAPAIVFIHGGAWVDESNSYLDWTVMAKYLLDRNPKRNVFGINYRLLPEVVHPQHVQDVLAALSFLAGEMGCVKVLLVGHLVGATLAFQMLTANHVVGLYPQTAAKFSIATVVFLDGIFAVKQLIEEYPQYSSFVNKAFEAARDYTHATAICESNDMKLDQLPDRIFILYSTEDELLSPLQGKLMAKFLDERKLQYTAIQHEWGLHDEMYKDSRVCKLVADAIL